MKKALGIHRGKMKAGQVANDQVSSGKGAGRKVSRKTSIFLKSQPENITEEDLNFDLEKGTDDWLEPKQLLKPRDQLQLDENELKEEFTRILTANNPNAPENIIRYSFNDRCFKHVPHIEQMAVHFVIDGCVLHKGTTEAKKQATKEIVVAKAKDGGESEDEDQEDKDSTEGEEVGEEGAINEQKGETECDSSQHMENSKKLTNQFNFSERASQTYNNPNRDRESQTEPPSRIPFSANVSQWELYDSYCEDFERHQVGKGKDKLKGIGKKEEEKNKNKSLTSETQGNDINLVAKAAHIVDRMVNQNSFDEIAQDFKYWEDTSDEFRENDGTLLPLWRFSNECNKKLAVTALCWNPFYSDFFAVSYGSYDFMKQPRGKICCYTLKNPSFPEYSFSVDYGVMCIDIHKSCPHFIVAGCYDGSVAVYNLKAGVLPEYQSGSTTKHSDPVWQIKWRADDLDGNKNFVSVSSDGRISLWTVVKNELNCSDIITLRIPGECFEGPDGTQLQILGSGTAFDFHSQQEGMFLVGTEEGRIHKCSLTYCSQFLETYDAHHMALYRIQWNLYHPNIFITCSADWSIKLWDHTQKEPLFTFDLKSTVGDVCWAPFSSTVFAAVTADGKVHVFDLNVNKYDAICSQTIINKKKTKLTHIAFNSHFPIIIVGDDHGAVLSLKLSPNLRKVPRDKKGQELPRTREYEIAKLDKILEVVKDRTKTEEEE